MSNSSGLSKETKVFLYGFIAIIVIAIVILIIFWVKKLAKTASSITTQAVEEKVATDALKDAYGIDSARASFLREIAVKIANELGVGPNPGILGTWGNVDEDKVINWLNSAKTANEMAALKNIYENDIVPGSSFYDDLDTALDNSEFQRVNNLSVLIN